MNLHRRRLRILAPVIAVTAGGLLSRAQDAPTTRREAPTTRPAPQPFPGREGRGGRDGPGARAGGDGRPSTDSTTEPATKAVKLTLNYKDAPLDTVLDYLSDQAGFVVVKEGPVDGRVTVLSKQPVSRDEAVTILNAALKSNGFAAIQNGRQLKIIPWDKAKKGNIPVHFGEDPQDVADTEELITQVIPIHNVDATKLRQDLTPLMGTDADVTANDGSNTIVMTATSSSIRRIVQIIHDLDLEETTVSEMRIIQLKFASASETVKLIDAIFKTEPGSEGGGRGQQMDPRMMQQMQQQGGQMPGAAAGGSRRARGKVTAAADDRTNTLILNGPSDSLKIIDGILEKLDANPVPASVIRAFPLRYADAESTSKLVQSIFHPQEQSSFPFFFGRDNGQNNAGAKNINTAFDDRTNTVIVTAPAEAMKDIGDMIKSLDANPVSASDLRVFTLKYADSDAVAKLVNSTFNPDAQNNNNNNGGGGRFRFLLFGGTETQSKNSKINATSDYRTNTVIVTAPAETMKVVEGIIKQLDSNPAAEDTLFIYHLRNAQSANLETVLNTLFGNVQNGQGGNTQNQNQNQTNRTTSGFGGAAGGSGGSSGRGLGQNTSTSSNANRNAPANNPGSKRPGLSPGMAQAVNELSGQVFVVADQDTNSLIVTTATKYEKQVRDIIHELDRPVPQVLIKVLVAEVTHDNSADWGADYSILNTRANKLGQTFGQTFGAPANGLLVSVVENQLNVTLHALAVEGKLDVLSRPYILASDNQLAEILVGSEVPLINNSYVTELGQTINSFQYQKVGIILDVTPHINPEGLVIMDVAPEISQLTDQSVPVGPGVSAPVIADRSAQTRVGIRDGQTIVIGGLMADSKTTTINKIPILGDIPLLKYVFSRTQVDKTKTELLIFITPHVAQQPDSLQPMSDSEIKGTVLTPRAVAPGVFDEHMRGMQRGEAPATRPAEISPMFEPGGSSPKPPPPPSSWSPLRPSETPTSRPASSQPARNRRGD